MTTLELDLPAVAPLRWAHPGTVVRVLAARHDGWAPHVRVDPTGPYTTSVWATTTTTR